MNTRITLNGSTAVHKANGKLNKVELTPEQLKALGIEDKPEGRWRAKYGETYHYVSSLYNGVLENIATSLETIADQSLFLTGNMFKSKGEALAYKEYLLALQKIKDFAGNWVPDWGDRHKGKFTIYYNVLTNTWDTIQTANPGVVDIYFPSEQLAEDCIKQLNVELDVVRNYHG